MESVPNRRVLLIGWDAADWNVARPLMEGGKMPNLQRLCEEGLWGRLATIRPVLSPMLWTSIATGKRAWKHGIHGFSEPCPVTGGIRPITNLSRKTKAVWNMFSQQGWKSNVIGWWPSHPAEPIKGVMVSNHFQQAVRNLGEEWPMRPGTVHPKRLEEPLKEMRIHPAELENEHVLPFIPRAAEIDQEKDKRMESCAKIIAEISGIHAAATAVMQLEPWDFMAVYYDGIDHFGHGFMRYHPPRQPWVKEEDFELYRNVIESGYRFHDMMLGVLMALAGEETTIMLISDHGFEPGLLRPQHIPNEPAGPAAEHSPFGIFCLRGPGLLRGECVYGASLLDVAPTLLHLYGLPVGRDMDGKVLVNCFDAPQSIEWVDSWDEIPGEDGRHAESVQLDVVESRESLRQLVDLGYIDEPDPDRGKAIDETIRELKYNLAQAYMDGGRYANAAEILEQQWERWPEESRFGTKLLSCCLATRDAARARASFEKLVARKHENAPKAAEELKKLQEQLKEQQEKAKAEAEEKGEVYTPSEPDRRTMNRIRRLRGQAGTNVHALNFFQGAVLALEKRYDEALDAYRKAEKAQTANLPSLYSAMGEIYLERGDYEAAEQEYARVLEITDQDPAAHLGLARSFLPRRRYFEASAEALAALELQFHNPRAHLIYGSALMKLGQPQLAEQVMLTAIAQNPVYPEAHLQLAQLYREFLQRPALAMKHADLARLARERIHLVRAEGTASVALPKLEFPTIVGADSRLKAEENPLIVVSGLPRSGTSLMMQMLAAGGIDVFTDGVRVADPSNPRGYYEYERVKKLASERDRRWLAEVKGQAIKIVAPLLVYLPPKLPARIVFMERPAAEVLESQRALLERAGKRGADLEAASLSKVYAMQLASVNEMLKVRESMELLPVSYAETVSDPIVVASQVAAFLKRDLDTKAMAASVDRRLYRVRQ